MWVRIKIITIIISINLIFIDERISYEENDDIIIDTFSQTSHYMKQILEPVLWIGAVAVS